MLRHRGEIAARNTVPPDVPFLEMSDGNRQHVAVPPGRSKTTPCMRRICGRMRTSIQVVNVVDGTQPLRMEGGDLPGDRIDFLGNAELRRTTPDVIGRVRPALPF